MVKKKFPEGTGNHRLQIAIDVLAELGNNNLHIYVLYIFIYIFSATNGKTVKYQRYIVRCYEIIMDTWRGNRVNHNLLGEKIHDIHDVSVVLGITRMTLMGLQSGLTGWETKNLCRDKIGLAANLGMYIYI